MEMIPKVLQAIAGQNHLVYIYFHDGTVRLYDASPYWKRAACSPPCGTMPSFETASPFSTTQSPGIWTGTVTQPPASTWTPVSYMSPAPW